MFSFNAGGFLRFLAAFLLMPLLTAAAPARLASVNWPARQAQAPVVIDTPQDGDVLQGVVTVSGTTDLAGFRSMEVSFSYPADPTGTWFLIQQSTTPVAEDVLAKWDTTTISDGQYRLRVRVYLQDGQVQESVVNDLRVRNYTPVETRVAAEPGRAQGTPTPTASPLPDYQYVARETTPVPTNPAQITPSNLSSSALLGVAAVVGGLIAAGIYLGLRALLRH